MKILRWVGYILPVFSVFIGFVCWLESIHQQGIASANDIKEIKQHQDKYLDDMAEIKENIGKIKGKLQIQ